MWLRFRLSRQLLAAVKAPFEPHLGELAILRGVADGQIASGELVVSHHNNGKASVIVDSSIRMACNGFIQRNRALSGDEVFVTSDTPSSVGSRTIFKADTEPSEPSLEKIAEIANNVSTHACKVVGIKNRSGIRLVSRIRSTEDLVQPRDTRFPAMRPGDKVEVSEPSLGIYKFKDWRETEHVPDCDLLRLLGPEGSFDAEDDASLEMNGLLSDSYPAAIEADLRRIFPDSKSVVAREVTKRKDLRYLRIFSVDPPSAKDLDDAISIEQIGDDTWRIGVHVADVSYFVEPNSPVDQQAAQRATSVYLPRKVYPMLASHLSENLCSLLPNEDRLAFSVFFTVDKSGDIVDVPSIERTIINSKARLSYDEVDNRSIPDSISRDIERLMDLTQKIRSRRIENGSVTLDDRNSQEISFEFNTTSPVSVTLLSKPTTHKSSHDSHMMIEELMVIANKIVAERLCVSRETVPVLRRHADSEPAVVEAGKLFLAQSGIPRRKFSEIESISDLVSVAKAELSASLMSAFTHALLGEFNRAEYVVAPKESEGLSHWGVGAKRYMHFTSPIRRYADLIVHRKLASEHPEDEAFVASQLSRCNRNSKAAKDAEKDNKQFYFATLVKAFGNAGMKVEGVVRELVLPDASRNVKGSIVFYLPIIGDIRSQSLESLGLGLTESSVGDDGSVVSVTAKDRCGKTRKVKLLESMQVRAYVKNQAASIPKIHVRIDKLPLPPRKTKSSTR